MIILYTRSDCSYCTLAKQMLQQKNINYVEKQIGKDVTREEVLQLVETQQINNTLPIAYLKDPKTSQMMYVNYTGLLDFIHPSLSQKDDPHG